MARRSAKIVIVEGPSDNTALSVYLSRYFNVMSFLNRILSSDVISNKASYVKMLDLYDIIIKNNTTCCRFSYTE